MPAIAGTWRLASWSAVWAYEFDATADEFLYQDPLTGLPRTDDAGEVRGSTLAVGTDGSFSQTGQCDCPILTYDEEGVQVSGVANFGGVIREDRGRSYLLCSRGSGSADSERLRYNDKDTQICDSARLIDSRLIRTMCVVTDARYGDRVILVYQRGEAGHTSG